MKPATKAGETLSLNDKSFKLRFCAFGFNGKSVRLISNRHNHQTQPLGAFVTVGLNTTERNGHNLNKIKKRFNIRGYTLVESIVGGTIIAICSIILISGFITSQNLIVKGNEIKNKGQVASSLIEGATSTDYNIEKINIPNGVLSYKIGSDHYEINGSFTYAYDDTSSIGFTVFEPDIE